MKMNQYFILSMLLFFMFGILQAQKEAKALPLLKNPYLGQDPPGNTPQLFALEIISTIKHSEYGGHFSPSGKEFYLNLNIY